MFEFIEGEMPRERLIRLLRHLADELETKPNVEFINYTENYSPELACYRLGEAPFPIAVNREYSIRLREWKK